VQEVPANAMSGNNSLSEKSIYKAGGIVVAKAPRTVRLPMEV